eukprot:COSAG05_NODE_1171_length_5626_cov_7.557626_3_plen_160_part_00
MVTAADSAGLAAALGQRLGFGTAGLRGQMGAGASCMNELTVIQTTQGLCAYLEATLEGGLPELQARGVALGYDHRSKDTLRSEQFALQAAAVLLGRGVAVYLYSCQVHPHLLPRLHICTLDAPRICMGHPSGMHLTSSPARWRRLWCRGRWSARAAPPG